MLASHVVRDVLSLMHSCGMYNYSGQFAFKVQHILLVDMNIKYIYKKESNPLVSIIIILPFYMGQHSNSSFDRFLLVMMVIGVTIT